MSGGRGRSAAWGSFGAMYRWTGCISLMMDVALGSTCAAFEICDQVYGIDVDPEKVCQASQTLPNIECASVESLPYPDDFFDLVFSHEVLEHVPDDRAAVAEAYRVLKPGGHLVVFVPNRLYPFETHGIYWRGTYRFGNCVHAQGIAPFV